MEHKLQAGRSETLYQDPIESLNHEHQAMLQRLEMVERTLQYLESLPDRSVEKRCRVEQSRLRDWVNELSQQIDRHFAVEEEALFPILEEYIGKEHGPIEVMLQEHNNIKIVLTDLKRDLVELCKQTGSSRDSLLKNVTALGYQAIGLLRLHMSKEDQILFKICEVSLSSKEKNWVAQKIQTIEMNWIGNIS